jgi:hypothetical protein
VQVLVINGGGGGRTKFLVPSAVNTLVTSACIGTPSVTDNGTFGGVYLSRATLTAGSEVFSAYTNASGVPTEGLLCLIGNHPPIPVSADSSLVVTFEDAATVILYFDQLAI